MARKFLLEQMTWKQAREAFARTSFVVIPIGSTEQHGPHLPQNTDTILAKALATHVAEQSVGLVLPPLPIGYSWVWRDYPGSVSFSLRRNLKPPSCCTCDRIWCKWTGRCANIRLIRSAMTCRHCRRGR